MLHGTPQEQWRPLLHSVTSGLQKRGRLGLRVRVGPPYKRWEFYHQCDGWGIRGPFFRLLAAPGDDIDDGCDVLTSAHEIPHVG